METKKACNVVKKHIDEWDAMNLLAGGAPLDEYDIETKQIVEALPEIKHFSELAEKIKEIFDNMFDEEHNNDDCLHVAHCIWMELRREEDSVFFSE
ncbi:protein of unknown function [Alteribacillus persepolensis]|uniref:DUF1871 domain-containing protein n=1 Tax=Alteribacillus persepolensis TaxID=568899 RepID=A0A1G8EX24_9BACI|nr:DUF1871 family protein [Alteribacillus persepolensis]SDH74259.1 protein of unknown function [Alteribacillus persepolensis]